MGSLDLEASRRQWTLRRNWTKTQDKHNYQYVNFAMHWPTYETQIGSFYVFPMKLLLLFLLHNCIHFLWHSKVKSGKFGQSSKFGQRPCFFHFWIIVIKIKLTKQTLKILMRRLIISRDGFTLFTNMCPNLPDVWIYRTLCYFNCFFCVHLYYFVCLCSGFVL